MVSLQHFVQKGELGAIVLGSSYSFVLEILGKPDEAIDEPHHVVLRWGLVQISFARRCGGEPGIVERIAILCSPAGLALPAEISLSNWFGEEYPPVESFRNFLDRISYPPENVTMDEKGVRLASGVVAVVQAGRIQRLEVAAREENI